MLVILLRIVWILYSTNFCIRTKLVITVQHKGREKKKKLLKRNRNSDRRWSLHCAVSFCGCITWCFL